MSIIFRSSNYLRRSQQVWWAFFYRGAQLLRVRPRQLRLSRQLPEILELRQQRRPLHTGLPARLALQVSPVAQPRGCVKWHLSVPQSASFRSTATSPRTWSAATGLCATPTTRTARNVSSTMWRIRMADSEKSLIMINDTARSHWMRTCCRSCDDLCAPVALSRRMPRRVWLLRGGAVQPTLLQLHQRHRIPPGSNDYPLKYMREKGQKDLEGRTYALSIVNLCALALSSPKWTQISVSSFNFQECEEGLVFHPDEDAFGEGACDWPYNDPDCDSVWNPRYIIWKDKTSYFYPRIKGLSEWPCISRPKASFLVECVWKAGRKTRNWPQNSKVKTCAFQNARH